MPWAVAGVSPSHTVVVVVVVAAAAAVAEPVEPVVIVETVGFVVGLVVAAGCNCCTAGFEDLSVVIFPK